jgi:hypothetical protein
VLKHSNFSDNRRNILRFCFLRFQISIKCDFSEACVKMTHWPSGECNTDNGLRRHEKVCQNDTLSHLANVILIMVCDDTKKCVKMTHFTSRFFGSLYKMLRNFDVLLLGTNFALYYIYI